MKARGLSETLLDEVQRMRQIALRLRAQVEDPKLRSRMDMAVQELDEIPKIFAHDHAAREALAIPQARMLGVTDAIAILVGDVQLMPSDFGDTGGGTEGQ